MIMFLGYGVVFWTGIIAGVFLLLNFLTCHTILEHIKPKEEIRRKLLELHKYLPWITFFFCALHGILAILKSVFYIMF